VSDKPSALVLLAQGSEEMEAVISIDVLRRGGLEVIVAGVDGAEPIRCSRGVVISPDVALDDVNGDFRLVGAICAAPIALPAHGVFENRQLTSHPSVKAMLEEWGDYSEHPVVADGNLITSRGPGTAFPFALRIVGTLTDARRMVEIRAPMMFPVQVS